MKVSKRPHFQEVKLQHTYADIRLDGDNLPLFHGQADQDFDPTELAAEAAATRSSYHLEPAAGSSTAADSAAEWTFFDEEQSQWEPKFKEFQFRRPAEAAAGDQSASPPIRRSSADYLLVKKERVKPKNAEGINGQHVKKSVRKTDKDKNDVSDMNYFDEVTFKESYAKFSVNESERPREIIQENNRQLVSELPDLQEVDRQYLLGDQLPPTGKPPQQTSKRNPEAEHFADVMNESLNFFDEQLFHSRSDPGDEVQKSGESSGTKKTVVFPQNTPVSSEKNPPIKEIKIVKKLPRDQPKMASSALDYVRNLRKAELSGQSAAVDPVDSVGVGLMARVAAATTSLQTSVKAQKRPDGDDNVEVVERNYVDVSKYLPPDINQYTSNEVEELLITKVLYNDNEIVALWKPYGLPMFTTPSQCEAGRVYHSLEKYLPSLAASLQCGSLLEVHRLDQTTTGVLLFATTEASRKRLKKLFVERRIEKQYHAITNGVPSTASGIINIPISLGKLEDRYRQTLRPDYNASKVITNKRSYRGDVSVAATDFRVVDSYGSAALVECNMLSGVKHQIRVHLGLGLSTPVLGDSKYSWPDRMGPPQKVKGDIRQRLRIRQSHTRNLPIFLHARRISVPDVLPDTKLTILASTPHFFTKVLRKLKLNAHE